MVEFYKDLPEGQKNALASASVTESYTEGQIIFEKGDAANSLYVIKEGIVCVKEKDMNIPAKFSFGESAIMSDNSTRTNTIVAKTNCILVSISRQDIQTIL